MKGMSPKVTDSFVFHPEGYPAEVLFERRNMFVSSQSVRCYGLLSEHRMRCKPISFTRLCRKCAANLWFKTG